MKQLKLIAAFLFLIFFIYQKNTAQSIDFTQAQKYFDDIKTYLVNNGNDFWGVSLYGPIMLVDSSTKEIVTNEADPEGVLKQSGNVYYGKLDAKDIIANTAYNKFGKQWTMIMLPLDEDINARRVLLIHEMFHRIQDDLKLTAEGEINNHLDKKEARILLRLELEALNRALQNKKENFIKDIESALIFRELRRKKFPEGIKSESALEIHEGIPEYTGVKLGIENENVRNEFAAKIIAMIEKIPSFVRSFAYFTGPLYGLLLDRSKTEWRKKINSGSDLGSFAAAAFNIKIPVHLENEYEKRLAEYNGSSIINFENERESERLRTIAMYKSKFMEGAVLILNFVSMKIQFDPRNLVSLENFGTVYPTLKIIDEWGTIETEKGALIDPNWSKVIVALPFEEKDGNYSGDGWKLQLNSGWKVIKTPGSENYFVVKSN
ncbi:MAG: hypothetical protein HYS25_14510 [Ignavibacteriales bacterium]|nr:hypothetical protein [Ignavibacteriales bacterium]